MKTKNRKLPAGFGPKSRFEIRHVPTLSYRSEEETGFERLKKRVLAARLEEVWEPEYNSALRRAANEAASLAWLTPFPALFFPVLFEEKAEAAVKFGERQAEVRAQTAELLAV